MKRLFVISLLIVALTAITYFNMVSATTNPVVWYKFDETSGTTAADSSGNGKNATLVNGPTWVAGKSATRSTLTAPMIMLACPAGLSVL